MSLNSIRDYELKSAYIIEILGLGISNVCLLLSVLATKYLTFLIHCNFMYNTQMLMLIMADIKPLFRMPHWVVKYKHILDNNTSYKRKSH